MSQKAKATTKYIPVAVNPQPVSDEEVTRHIRAFIERFILPPRQYRWIHCLLEMPDKSTRHLVKFGHDLDERYCTELKGSHSFPSALEERFGSTVGVYFSGPGAACKVTAAEAATLATETSADALWSFVPGESGLFFEHEGHAWVCAHHG